MSSIRSVFYLFCFLILYGEFGRLLLFFYAIAKNIKIYRFTSDTIININIRDTNLESQIDHVFDIVRENIYKSIEILIKCIETDQYVKNIIITNKLFSSGALVKKLYQYIELKRKIVNNDIEICNMVTMRIDILSFVEMFMKDLIIEMNGVLMKVENPDNIFIAMKKIDDGYGIALVKKIDEYNNTAN